MTMLSTSEPFGLDDAPDAPAFCGMDGSAVPRGQVRELAHERAALITSTVPTSGRVAVIDTGDHDMLASVLGAFIAGRSAALIAPETGRDLAAAAAAAGCHLLLRGEHPQVLDEPSAEPLLHPAQGCSSLGSPEAVVLFTSGTTSEPRGVRLSRAGIASNLSAMSRVTSPWGPDDRLGLVLSMAHSFGLSMALLAFCQQVPIVPIGGAAPNRTIQNAFDTARVTILGCVPYYLRLLERRGFRLGSGFAPHLRVLLLAGGGISDEARDLALLDYDGECFAMYGLTEATARVAVRRIGDDSPPDSVGLPLPGTRVDIVDADGVPVPLGGEGRIRVASPSLLLGYLGEQPRPPGQPFVTTDLGRMADTGHLTITGRESEMLNFRGTRVSVVAIEAAATQVEGVSEARFAPDSQDEDTQGTLELVREPEADEGAIRREVVRVVTPRGIIKTVSFVPFLETTRSGKPLRRRPR